MSLSETYNGFADGSKAWAIYDGDCIEEMARMPEESIDFSVFSPPFSVGFRLYV
jgi:DNA modification methylase